MKSLALMCLAVLAAPVARAEDSSRPIVLHVILSPANGGDVRLSQNANLTHATNYTAGRRVLAVAGAEDFARRLRELKDSGVRVRQMIIDVHGAPAYSQIMSASSLSGFQGLDELFAPGAQIFFSSCNTGQGEEGLAFVRAVGRTLLARNGGRVTAAVDYVRFLPAYLRPLGGPLTMAHGDISLKGYIEVRVQPGQEDRLYYLPPGTAEAMLQLDTRANQAVDLAQYQIQTLADIARVQGMIMRAGVQVGAQAAVRAAPVINRLLPYMVPGAGVLRLFQGN